MDDDDDCFVLLSSFSISSRVSVFVFVFVFVSAFVSVATDWTKDDVEKEECQSNVPSFLKAKEELEVPMANVCI